MTYACVKGGRYILCGGEDLDGARKAVQHQVKALLAAAPVWCVYRKVNEDLVVSIYVRSMHGRNEMACLEFSLEASNPPILSTTFPTSSSHFHFHTHTQANALRAPKEALALSVIVVTCSLALPPSCLPPSPQLRH